MHLYIIVILWIITQVCGLFGAKQSGIAGEFRGEDINHYPTEALERLSKLFGISKIPEHLQHGTPPEYMLTLFNSVAFEDGITKKSAPYNANTVRGIPDRALHQQILYYFNLSHVDPSENILEAEFHIFKVSPQHRIAAAAPQRVGHVVELKLYQVIDPDHPQNANVQKLLHHRRVSAHDRGWEIFSVKDTVKQWIIDDTSNHGFLIETTTIRGDSDNVQHLRFAQRSEHHDSKQPLLVIFTEDSETLLDLDGGNEEEEIHDSSESLPSINAEDVVRDSTEINIEGNIDDSLNYESNVNHTQFNNGTQNPQLDTLSKLRKNYVRFLNEEHRAQFINQRTVMSPELHRRLISGQLQVQGQEQRPHRGSRQKRGVAHSKFPRRRKKTCSLHELYVDFEEIGWSGWIISPKGYNAFHCKGACQFPLGQNQQPTNHATVQSIVNAFRAGRDVGTPCCVPNKLYSISLLYFDDQENVILKQYDDMVAVSCGCH